MSTTRALPVARLCQSCQRRTLNSFVSGIGLPIQSLSTRSRAQFESLTPTSRPFSIATPRYNESQKTFWSAQSSLEDATASEPDPTKSHSPDTTKVSESELPWYLQVGAQEAISSRSNQQELPDIPADAPDRLRPILEHLSLEVGLDDLTLLDLRKLDPPPALGGNLFMIVGTARSEKHLHVSADRICRWLRSEYKLRPFADGLLGRNELKLKLRRKNRRAKLLGGTRRPDEDDGIHADWICVNAGAIEGESGAERTLEGEGIVGFGGREDGAQVVVQMMTNNKRYELDLEKLWRGFIKRQEGSDLIISSGIEEHAAAVPQTREVRTSPKSQPTHDADGTFSSSTRSKLFIPHRGQRREYHVARETLVQAMYNSSAAALASDASATGGQNEMDIHLQDLRSLSLEEARAALGSSADARTQTEHLGRFYDSLPSQLDPNHWTARMDLVTFGLSIGHKGYTVSSIVDLLHEAEESCWKLPHSIYEVALEAIASDSSSRYGFEPSDPVENLRLSLSMLEQICVDTSTPSTSMLQSLALTFACAHAANYHSNDSFLSDNSPDKFARILTEEGVFNYDPEFAIAKLTELATRESWDSYWQYWRKLPSALLRRPQKLYAAMFNHLAATSHQTKCADALTTWISHLEIENPPVTLGGDLALATMQCLKVASPLVEKNAESRTNENNQWVKLWRRCEAGLQLQPENTLEMQAISEQKFAHFIAGGLRGW